MLTDEEKTSSETDEIIREVDFMGLGIKELQTFSSAARWRIVRYWSEICAALDKKKGEKAKHDDRRREEADQ